MLGNGFQDCVCHVGEFPNFDRIWDLGPLTYCRNTFKHIIKIVQIIVNIRCVWIWDVRCCVLIREMCVSRFCKSRNFRSFVCFVGNFNFETLKCGSFVIWNVDILIVWKIEILKYWHVQTFEIAKVSKPQILLKRSHIAT